ncbi:hypothetical protein PHISCL_00928 [Aspergillus sclerotialis]|uniref:Uncharacterized protein n=1 Tax=Aspergillus sclerotialis TaxID=2070753 RepID=A0A3A2ZZ95_9EURO|nr:hypothetical protein PHISCL_00928 [Aspergillus sclerotialis]
MAEETLSQFLDGLPEKTPQHQFVSLDDFYGKLIAHKDNEGKESFTPMIIFLNMPEERFQEMTRPSPNTELMSHFLFAYSHPLRCIILGYVSEIHRFIKDSFANLIDRKITEMGLYSEMERPGSVARSYGSVSKQPDASWTPTKARDHVVNPTLLLEIGQARSVKRMEEDARRWLTFVHTPIFNVVVVKAFDYPKIVVQIWGSFRMPQFRSAGKRIEAIITRSNGETVVERHSSAVGNPPVTMPFERVFLREKNKENPREGDFVFTDQDLQSVVESIWKAQRLI